MLENQTLVYHPDLIPRRGEYIAWLLCIIVWVGWIALRVTGFPLSWWGLPVLGVLLIFSAGSISLGNWMDRRTVITVEGSALNYADGLRRVRMTWDEVQEVRVFPSQWGSKVQVLSKTGYFSFRTLAEVVLRGKVRGTMGFQKGDEILRHIILNSGLQVIDHPGEGYYYARV
jgi:hypothetical protein